MIESLREHWMNRRDFLALVAILPMGSYANPVAGWFVRGILRSSFRTLSRRAFSSVGSNVVRSSIARTSSRITQRSKIDKIFGRRTHTIKDKNGRVVGNAKVESNVLMIRNTQKQILGYMQYEKNTLALYSGNGTRVIVFRQNDSRIVAYNQNEEYLGQIIEKTIKDEIESVFIDALGKEHKLIPVEIHTKEESIALNDNNTTISNNRLQIYNKNGKVVLYGVANDNDILLYDKNNHFKGKLQQIDGKIYLYDANGKLVQEIDKSNKGALEVDL